MPESDLEAFKAFEKAGWERAADPYHQHWGNLSRQSADAMVDAAGVAPETRVLDVTPNVTQRYALADVEQTTEALRRRIAELEAAADADQMTR